MAASSLLTFAPLPLPNPSPNSYRYGESVSPVNVFSRLSFAYPFQSRSLLLRCLNSDRSFVGRRGHLDIDSRISMIVPFASSHEESKHSDIEVEKENELESATTDSQEALKQTLESFKEEAKKMKEVSQEAYEVYSKKAKVIMKEASEKLKIQAEKSRHEMTTVAKEISKEGKVYLDTLAKNSPDSVKDVVQTFAASTDELKEISAVRDFYLGIPYGAFLAVGGFLSFMLTGSISAIRFGVILGSALLALSISSLRSWKSGQSYEPFLKGQAGIAAVIFIREWLFFCEKRLFSTLLMTLISGAILCFYIYRIIIDGKTQGPSSEHSSED